MNVDQIYQLQRDDAFAEQFDADDYETFVAMPFNNQAGYSADRIKDLLCNHVHVRANTLLNPPPGARRFAPLRRVDAGSAAIVITDEIIRRILTSHFFLADLSGQNFGVVLETGIGLALKPNGRVVLFTQDERDKLHFDIKVTNINRYTEADLVEQAAQAMVSVARNFETEADRYIRFVSRSITPDAHRILNIYGRIWKGHVLGTPAPSLHEDTAARYSADRFDGISGSAAFHNAARELLERRLLRMGYEPSQGGDWYGLHATKLGWKVIETIWHHDPEMRQSPDAPTGPH